MSDMHPNVVRVVEAARRLGLEIPDSSVWRTASGAHHVNLHLPNGLSLDLDSSALAARYNAGWRETGAAVGAA